MLWRTLLRSVGLISAVCFFPGSCSEALLLLAKAVRGLQALRIQVWLTYVHLVSFNDRMHVCFRCGCGHKREEQAK